MQEFNTIYKEKSIIVDCNNKKLTNLGNLLKFSGSYIEDFKIPDVDASDMQCIAVVGAGMSAEREISLISSDGIVDALLELGYDVIFIDMGIDIAHVINIIRPDIVFNALHGTYGEDGCLPGVLNILRIPYTGAGLLASSLAMNKKKSYEILSANNIKIAPAITVSKSDNLKSDPIPRPYVIKPLSQGSSVGVEVIFEEDQFSFADYQFKYGNEILVEQYIKGREIQVGLLNGKAMGVLEIQIVKEGKRFYDYDVKYTEGYAKHLLPAPIENAASEMVMRISEKACRIFNCMSGIVRAEFIYNQEENAFYMLELNTHPGMTPLSIVPEVVAEKGINYTDLVYQILQSATFEP